MFKSYQKARLKKFGFWKEEGYNRMPSIKDYLMPTALKNYKGLAPMTDVFAFQNNKKRLRRMPLRYKIYLNISPIYAACMSGWSKLDGSYLGGETWLTDGKWLWIDSIIYDYEYNGLELSQEFKNYLFWKIIPYPILFKLKCLLSRDKVFSYIDESLQNDADFLDIDCSMMPDYNNLENLSLKS